MGVYFISIMLHGGSFMQRCEVRTGYLQSLQEAEVLKGSPLHDADLIVLQMTVAADRERKTHRSMLLNIITIKKTNNLGAKSAETFQRNSRDQTAGEINERLKCLTAAEVEKFAFSPRQKRQF